MKSSENRIPLHALCLTLLLPVLLGNATGFYHAAVERRTANTSSRSARRDGAESC